MPYRRPDSPIYWASYADASGKRVRRPTGTSDLGQAKALEAKWKLEAHQQKQWGKEPERSIEEVMLAFLRAKADKRSQADDKLFAKRWRELLPGRSIQGLKPADIEGFISARKATGVCNATVNRELSFLAACINYCRQKLGWELPNPILGRKLKEPEGRLRWLSYEEGDALVQAAASEQKAPYLADFIVLALHTGMRRGEILGLEWKRVNLQTGLIHLEVMHTKTGKRRSVPLNQTAQAAILSRMNFRAAHCPASPWVISDAEGNRIGSIKRSFATACRRAGIENFRTHDLRHTCAAWLVTVGVPLPEVRDLLGHTTVEMTERYAHLAPENVRAAVSKLDRKSRLGHAE